jgi:hypothetical protein
MPPPEPAPLAALVAGLAALIEAHKASATSGAALVLWRVLASLHALASRALAAPSDLAIEALDGGAFAAGLLLRPQGAPSAPTPTPAPQLAPVHRRLVGHTGNLLEEIDEARWHAQQLASDLEVIATNGTDFLAGAHETLAALRSALHLAEGSGCALSASLSGEEPSSSPGRHIAALSRLWVASSPALREDLARAELRHAAEAFASASP